MKVFNRQTYANMSSDAVSVEIDETKIADNLFWVRITRTYPDNVRRRLHKTSSVNRLVVYKDPKTKVEYIVYYPWMPISDDPKKVVKAVRNALKNKIKQRMKTAKRLEKKIEECKQEAELFNIIHQSLQ